MKAMVLAAGLGERMIPLTLATPKPAIPVLGRPLLVEVLRGLARQGIREATVNLHHLRETVAGLLADAGLGIEKLHLSPEDVILGTAGGIRRAAPFLRGAGPFLVRNADFLADIDVRAVAESHRASGAAATLVLALRRPGYSEVAIDAAGRIVSIGGRPETDPARVAGRYLFTGCHVLNEEVIDRIPPEGASDIVRHVYRDLLAEGRLHAVVHDGFWWEFGAPREYLEGSLRLLGLPAEERAAIFEADPVHAVGDAILAVGPGADLHHGVELRGRVSVGFACLVGEGSVLEDSIVLPETWIGPGCRIRRSIVGPNTELPAGFEADGIVVCADPDPEASPPEGTTRSGALLIRRFEAAAP